MKRTATDSLEERLKRYGVAIRHSFRVRAYEVRDNVSGLSYRADRDWLMLHLAELEATEGVR